MNLSSSGMASMFKQDVVSRQLFRSASSGGKVYDPTSAAQKSNHEIDKQAEENATWFFEYKALLNSKLTTLTTTLTSAYTTDLDAAMAKTDPLWNNRNAMQGITGTRDGSGNTIIDPGAMRTAYSYLRTYGINVTSPPNAAGSPYPAGTDWSGYGTDANTPTVAASFTFNGTLNGTTGVDQDPGTAGAQTNITNKVQGTTSFLTGSEIALERLEIDLRDAKNNDYTNAKTAWSGYPENIAPGKRISNNLQLSLYRFFSKPENYDLLRFGLMDNLYVVGTSSLATGSQIQGSLSLKYQIDTKGTASAADDEAYIEVRQERFSCFFHS